MAHHMPSACVAAGNACWIASSRRGTAVLDAYRCWVPWSTSPRTYAKFNDIEKEIADARVLGGMHFRHSSMYGAQLGRKVARNLVKNFFQELR
jgi:hypothetical protein